MELNMVQQVAIWALPVLFAITVHEVAHGYVAAKLGDKTAYFLGRLTLNPLKHIDMLGTVIMPILLLLVGGFIFGWAKPVPVDIRNLRHGKSDMALVAAAGPIANLLMALLWAVIAKIGLMMTAEGQSWGGAPLFYMGKAGIMINVMLAVLNLLPIPPLDGGRVLSGLISGKLAVYFSRLEPYGFFILLILMMSGMLSSLLSPIISQLIRIISNMVGL